MSIPLIAVGAFFIFDTLFILCRSNINMGVVMPAIIGAPLLLYGLFFDRLNMFFSVGAGKILFIIILVCYSAYIVFITVSVIVISSSVNYSIKTKPDYILVLGAAVHGTVISKALKNRLDTAVRVWSKYPDAKIIVSGGKGKQEEVTEASAMKKYLISVEIPCEKIIAEDKATSTFENFRFSKQLILADTEQSRNTVYITNDFHLYRAGIAARSAGFSAYGIGCKSPFYIIPNYYMRESLAVFRYFLIGLR